MTTKKPRGFWLNTLAILGSCLAALLLITAMILGYLGFTKEHSSIPILLIGISVALAFFSKYFFERADSSLKPTSSYSSLS